MFSWYSRRGEDEVKSPGGVRHSPRDRLPAPHAKPIAPLHCGCWKISHITHAYSALFWIEEPIRHQQNSNLFPKCFFNLAWISISSSFQYLPWSLWSPTKVVSSIHTVSSHPFTWWSIISWTRWTQTSTMIEITHNIKVYSPLLFARPNPATWSSCDDTPPSKLC